MTPTVYNTPPAAMNATIETGSVAVTLSYAIMPLHPIATYKTMETVSKRPGNSSFRTIPTTADDQMVISKDVARLLSLS